MFEARYCFVFLKHFIKSSHILEKNICWDTFYRQMINKQSLNREKKPPSQKQNKTKTSPIYFEASKVCIISNNIVNVPHFHRIHSTKYAHSFVLSYLYCPLGAPFINMVQLLSQHGWVITSIISCGMKLFIHSQTLMIIPLKFGDGSVISLNWACDYLSIQD